MEEVWKLAREDICDAPIRKLDAKVGEYRRINLVVEGREAQLDIFSVANVLGGSAGLTRNPVEELRKRT